jgi:DNA recombination protein RmuC
VTIVLLLLVSAAAAGLTFLLMRARAARDLADARAQAAASVAAAQAQAQDAQQQALDARAELAGQREAIVAARAAEAALKQDNHRLGLEIARQREALDSTKSLLDTADARLREAFQSLAAEALQNNRGAFLDLARASLEGWQQHAASQIDARHRALDTLVQPITDTLKKVETRLEESERDRLQSFTRLMEQITTLGSTTQTLSRALRTPAVRGRWG